MNAEGRIRNWIDPFDRWHLWVLPPILVGLLVAIILLPHHTPTPPTRPIPLPVPAPVSPAPTNPVQVPPAAPTVSQALRTAPAQPANAPQPRQPRPTRIESPSQNALFWRDRLGDVEGNAEPSCGVRLYLGEKPIGAGVTDSEGRFRFRLANFPPGQHRIQVIASNGSFSKASETVSFTVKAERSPKPSPSPKAGKKTDTPQRPAAGKKP